MGRGLFCRAVWEKRLIVGMSLGLDSLNKHNTAELSGGPKTNFVG